MSAGTYDRTIKLREKMKSKEFIGDCQMVFNEAIQETRAVLVMRIFDLLLSFYIRIFFVLQVKDKLVRFLASISASSSSVASDLEVEYFTLTYIYCIRHQLD